MIVNNVRLVLENEVVSGSLEKRPKDDTANTVGAIAD